MSDEREVIARIELCPDTTSEDLTGLIQSIDRGADRSVERVHDPTDDEPDFFVTRPRGDSDA